MQCLEEKLQTSTEKLKDDNRELVDLLHAGLETIKRDLVKTFRSRSSTQCANPDVISTKTNACSSQSVPVVHCDDLSIRYNGDAPLRKKAKAKILQHKKVIGERKSGSQQDTRSFTRLTEIGAGDASQTLHSLEDSKIKSILKRRKIIDDNVKVTSKYSHSPVTTPKTSRRNLPVLAHSYSSDEDCDIGESFSSSILSDLGPTGKLSTASVPSIQKNKSEFLEKVHLLHDPGNDRQHASIVKDIEKRPKNTIFDLEAPESSCTHFDKSSGKISDYKRKIGPPPTSRIREAEVTYDGHTLLGYDWIAGILENADIGDQPQSLLKEIQEFRQANKEDCVGPDSLFDRGIYANRPISPQIQDPGHTCVHGYTINDRLYTQPTNISEDGSSMCPICLAERKPPSKAHPGFVRVSIPKSMMKSESKVIPATRKTYDPSDSLALSKHCLAGWQNSKPISKPAMSSFDIKDSVMAKQSTTVDEAEQMTQLFSRMGRLLDGNTNPLTPAQQTVDSTNALIRYELQTAFRHAAPNLPIATWNVKQQRIMQDDQPQIIAKQVVTI